LAQAILAQADPFNSLHQGSCHPLVGFEKQ